MRQIDELHLQHPFMGARMLRNHLARQGVQLGRRYIGTPMRRMGIQVLTPQPGSSKRAPGHKVYPFLPRNLSITRANQVWVLEAACIPMAHGIARLTAVVDVFSRRVLAHRVAITPGKASRTQADPDRAAHTAVLRAIVRKHPHSSLDELTHELRRRTGIKVNTVAMRKALSAAGIVRLKPQCRMGERTAAQGAAARYGDTPRHRRPDNPNGMNTEVTDEGHLRGPGWTVNTF